jgi:hypothetical protein
MIETVKAKYGERQIFFKVGLFTNELAGERGRIRPKHAWDRGTVDVVPNGSHGIKSATAFFNSWSEIPLALEKAARKAGVKIHPGTRSRKVVTKG